MVDSERRNTMFAFNHFNFNVLDLEKSLKFYEEALGLKEVRRKEAEDGSLSILSEIRTDTGSRLFRRKVIIPLE